MEHLKYKEQSEVKIVFNTFDDGFTSAAARRECGSVGLFYD